MRSASEAKDDDVFPQCQLCMFTLTPSLMGSRKSHVDTGRCFACPVCHQNAAL